MTWHPRVGRGPIPRWWRYVRRWPQAYWCPRCGRRIGNRYAPYVCPYRWSRESGVCLGFQDPGEIICVWCFVDVFVDRVHDLDDVVRVFQMNHRRAGHVSLGLWRVFRPRPK